MSGHSKWSKVKHQKEVTDAVRGAAFTKASRAITIAVREGGRIADPEKNYHLRLALEKARGVNMPKDTIARAIERGISNDTGGVEQAIYEGYGPGAVAILIEAATDNRARTVSEIKHVLEVAGGTLGAPGSVRFLFEAMKPKVFMEVDLPVKTKIDTLVKNLMELEDVQNVYTNLKEFS